MDINTALPDSLVVLRDGITVYSRFKPALSCSSERQHVTCYSAAPFWPGALTTPFATLGHLFFVDVASIATIFRLPVAG